MRYLGRKKTVKLLCALLSAVLLIGNVQTVCFADEEYDQQMEQLNEKKEEATKNRINAQNKVEQLKQEQAAVIEEKMALEERNEAAQKEIDLIDEQIELVEIEIAATEKKIEIKKQEVEDAKNQEDVQLEKYRARIRAMEENGSYNILSLILSSDSYAQLLSALDDYGEIMNSDQLLYDQLVEARENHEKLEEEYEEYKIECEAKEAEYEKKKEQLKLEQDELKKQIEESAATIEEYTKKIEEAEEEQAAMEKAESAAAYAAANFINEYNAAKSAAIQSAASNTSEDTSQSESSDNEQQSDTSSSVEVYSGATGGGSYVWPFPDHYIVTSPFGYRSSTSSYHTGIDIDGYQSGGSPIVAADSGTVIKAEYYGGYGNCIIIDHGNGMSTLYAHLSYMGVSVGSSVSQGQTIGGVGNTGTCYGIDGIHLHFEIISDGTQVDPLPYLSGYSYTLY